MALKKSSYSMLTLAVVSPAATAPYSPVSLSYIAQSQNNWCWAACMEMIMPLAGPQCKIANTALGLGNCCASPGSAACDTGINDLKVTKLFGKFGLTVTYNAARESFATVQAEILARRPVEAGLVWSTASGAAPGHVVLIVDAGVNASGVDEVQVYDPKSSVGAAVVTYAHLSTAYGLGSWATTWKDIS